MTQGTTAADFATHSERLWTHRELFDPQTPLFIARAPGRFDVMGGIGDYSGSLVLTLPIAEAAFVAVQKSPIAGVAVTSLPHAPGEAARSVKLSANDWAELVRADYGAARSALRENPEAAWAAYVLGPVLVLLREKSMTLDGGLTILVDSRVPEGKGVSSSAAVEVAVLQAVAALQSCKLDGAEMARLCQVAENHVVGAPCGIMDQITAALGRENQLLALVCQPATVEGHVPIPQDVSFWGIDSGIRHAVSGSDYTSVRCATFMGYRIIAEAAGLEAKPVGAKPPSDERCVLEINDAMWGGYLANISPAEFEKRYAAVLPREILGADFLDRYGGTTDPVTRVDPSRTYALREPTAHPILENARVRRFRELLLGPASDAVLREMGQLMRAAHDSYSACGLGSDGTDLLVELVRERGESRGLFGAKITGGGSGGTVLVLGRPQADQVVDEIARDYSHRTGRDAYVFRGSSPGACSTGVRETTIDRLR